MRRGHSDSVEAVCAAHGRRRRLCGKRDFDLGLNLVYYLIFLGFIFYFVRNAMNCLVVKNIK